jgi:hypothetical protein
MRHKSAFFSFAFSAAAVLLAGTVAVAGSDRGHSGRSVPTPPPSPPPMSCSTNLFEARVSSGPTFVPCSAPGGQCTEIEYEVATTGHHHWKRKPSHVFVLQGVGVWDVEPGDSRWYAPCEGIGGEDDSGFGQGSCHEQAIKVTIKRRGATKFKVMLAGLRRSSPTSVAALEDVPWWYHDDEVKACTILGLGLEAGPNPDQTTLRKETINFKGCEVEFTRDPVNEEVVEARLLTEKSDSGEDCESPTLDEQNRTIKPLPAGEVEVSVGRFNLGSGKFGVGYLSTGTESCTTRVIGGRLYTWGAPCPP